MVIRIVIFKMPKSKKGGKEPGSGRGVAGSTGTRPSKKRLRLKTSEDEEEEQEKEEEARGGASVSRRRRGGGGEGEQEEGASSRRGSSRGAGSSRGVELKVRSVEEVNLCAWKPTQLNQSIAIWK